MTFQAADVTEEEYVSLMKKAKDLSDQDQPYWDGVFAVMNYLDGTGKHPDHFAPEGD